MLVRILGGFSIILGVSLAAFWVFISLAYAGHWGRITGWDVFVLVWVVLLLAGGIYLLKRGSSALGDE
jgi:hypothetical protein